MTAHLVSLLGVTPFHFCRDSWHQKTRVSALSYGVVCVKLRLAVSVDAPTSVRQTDIQQQLIPAVASVAWVKKTESSLDVANNRMLNCQCFALSDFRTILDLFL